MFPCWSSIGVVMTGAGLLLPRTLTWKGTMYLYLGRHMFAVGVVVLLGFTCLFGCLFVCLFVFVEVTNNQVSLNW